MSKLKTPREKKIASLLLDRRNAYGENDKSSRESIRRGKQRGHQAARRAINQPLRQIATGLEEDVVVELENEAKSAEIKGRRELFRKKPDQPLGDHIASHAYWAKRRAEENDYWKARRSGNASQ